MRKKSWRELPWDAGRELGAWIAARRAELKAATPAPWRADDACDDWAVFGPESEIVADLARAIASLRNAAPAMLAALEAAIELLDCASKCNACSRHDSMARLLEALATAEGSADPSAGEGGS